MIIDGKNLKEILDAHSLWILTKGRSGELAELKGLNLDGANLEMANLPFANLHSASLKGAHLQGANFRRASLKRINLCGARLSGADFEGANLAGADLRFAVCSGTNFKNANLTGSNFIKAELSDANFYGANLRGANFKNANLLFSDMRKANLEKVNFRGTYLKESHFNGSYLNAVKFEKKISRKANYHGALYSTSEENELEFSRADFTYQDLMKLITDSSTDMQTKEEDITVELIAIDQSLLEDALRGLINKIQSNISNDNIKEIIKERYGMEKIDEIEFERGDIVSQNQQISFKLDFRISTKLSILIDRRGKCTVVSSSSMPEDLYQEEPVAGSTHQNY